MKRLCVFLAAFIAVSAIALPARAAIDVQVVDSPGGIRAWLVEDHTNPIITIAVYFRAGARYDPEGKAGTARMMAALLDEGAGDMDSQAFQARIENLSIDWNASAGRDRVRVRMQTLTRNRDEAFRLMRLALAEPRFDESAVGRIRGQIQSLLRVRANRAETIAREVWFAARFPEHPYGRPVWGEPDSVAAIRIDDLRTYHRNHIARSNMVVGVVGDITAQALAPLLDRTLGELPAEADQGEPDNVEPRLSGDMTVVRRPFPQSVVMFGQPGLTEDHPDFLASYVLNHILGGGTFSSRLHQEVREERGLTYSISTSLRPMDEAALIVGDASTRHDRAARMIEIIREEWRRISREGVSAEELEAAKQFLTGSYPLRFASSGNIAALLAARQLQGRSIEYFAQRNDLIRAVTLEQVNRLARTLLDPDQLTFVVVGQPEGL